jgi:hypothetical protein
MCSSLSICVCVCVCVCELIICVHQLLVVIVVDFAFSSWRSRSKGAMLRHKSINVTFSRGASFRPLQSESK